MKSNRLKRKSHLCKVAIWPIIKILPPHFFDKLL